MRAEHDPQLQPTPKRTPAKRRNLFCVGVPTRLSDEQERRREKLCKVLAEKKFVLICVSDSIRHQLMSVLARRLDAFAADDDDVGYTTVREHRIETRNSLPFRQKNRPARYARRNFIERALNRLLRLGIISVANTREFPYASPIEVAAKKDCILRICEDYLHLKQRTINDAYPLLRIDEILTSLHNAYRFVALDLMMTIIRSRWVRRIARKLQ